MRAIRAVSVALVAIGGLNWGLVGFFDFDLVAEIFGDGSTAARVVYAAVGVATVVMLATFVPAARTATNHHAEV